MKIRIKETGAIEELYIADRGTGCEYTQALVEDDDCITYNHALEMYETDEESYKWWENMLEKIEHAEDVKAKYAYYFGREEVYRVLSEAYYCNHIDLEDQPDFEIAVLEEEFGPLPDNEE